MKGGSFCRRPFPSLPYPPPLFPFFPIPYPFRRLLCRLHSVHIFGARHRQIRGRAVRWDIFILFILRKLESLSVYRCHEGECLEYPGAFTVGSQPLDREKEEEVTQEKPVSRLATPTIVLIEVRM